MQKSIITRCGMAAALMAMAAIGVAQFNNSPTLKIGDPAPEIQVKAWVKGKPVTRFEKGRVYLVNFWATW